MKESNGCNANARNGSDALFADIAFFSFSVLASFVTLCVEVDPDSMVPLRGWTLVSFKHLIVLFTACVLLICDHVACSKGKRYPFRRKGDTAKPPQLIAALLFALMVLLGQSLDAAESLAPLYETVSSASIALLRFCGLAIFAYRSLDFLMRFLDLINLAAPLNRPLPAWLPYASISACWMIYFILLFPGSIPTDTSRQLAQFFGAEGTVLDNHFPYFTSLVFGLLFQLGTLISNDGIASVALMSGFQIALGVYVYGTIALWINRLKAPKWLAILSIAFFSLFPLFPSHALTISKDYVHACIFSLFALQLILYSKSKNAPGTIGTTLTSMPTICITATLLCLTRNNGVFVAVPTLIILAAAFRTKTALAACAVSVALFVSWQSVVLPSLGVLPGETREALSVPAQIIGRYYANGYQPTEDMQRALERSITVNPNELAERYNPELSDDSKAAIKTDETFSAASYVSVALHMGLEHPGSALSATLNTTFGFWYPFNLGSYWPLECVPYYPTRDDAYALPDSWFSGSGWIDRWNDDRLPITEQLQRLRTGTALVTFLYRPGTYIWLILLIITYALTRRMRKRQLIALTPFLLLLLTLLAGPCASLRYSLPFIFSMPLFFLAIQPAKQPEEQRSINADAASKNA